MTLVDYASPSQRRCLWYSPNERDELKRELLHDVQLVSLHLARTPMERVHHTDLVMCIGMEALLSPELSRLVKLRKKRHVKLILRAQARGMDAEELRQLSEGSSRWTRDRSGALAAGYWDILRDPAQELLQEAVPSREPHGVAPPSNRSSSSGRTRFLHRDSLAMSD